jgi:hypothetical protein
LDALENAEDAFEGRTQELPTPEAGIAAGGGWKTQLIKACQLLDAVEVIQYSRRRLSEVN